MITMIDRADGVVKNVNRWDGNVVGADACRATYTISDL